MKPLIISLTLILTTFAPYAERITATEAKNHIGETATVCGVVASATYASRSRGKPTFLNLDRPYPNHIFIALIWSEDRPKFGQPEVRLRGKRICVTGRIEEYRGIPEIILRNRGQLKVENQ